MAAKCSLHCKNNIVITSDDFKQVLGHRAIIERWHMQHGVPKFTSVAEAAAAITA